MKECFKNIRLSGTIDIALERGDRFTADKHTLCAQIIQLVERYEQEGYSLTLRQLYYQLVAADIIPNDMKMYRKLSPLVVELREAGLIDWDSIVDRARAVNLPWYTGGVADAISTIKAQYRLDRMSGQSKYIELWIEKDALSDVVGRVTGRYGIRLVVNKGYTSATFMYEAVQRMKSAWHCGKRPLILYMGDHDPSGLDMTRDIRDRMIDYRAPSDMSVEHIALLSPQISLYNPPPNPAKLSDPRAESYIERFGPSSWELDALRPQVLEEIAQTAILRHIDQVAYAAVLHREKADKDELTRLITRYNNDPAKDEDDDDDADDDGPDFCQKCATELPVDGDGRCPKCQYDPDDDECPHCGHRGDAKEWINCPKCDKDPGVCPDGATECPHCLRYAFHDPCEFCDGPVADDDDEDDNAMEGTEGDPYQKGDN